MTICLREETRARRIDGRRTGRRLRRAAGTRRRCGTLWTWLRPSCLLLLTADCYCGRIGARFTGRFTFRAWQIRWRRYPTTHSYFAQRLKSMFNWFWRVVVSRSEGGGGDGWLVFDSLSMLTRVTQVTQLKITNQMNTYQLS